MVDPVQDLFNKTFEAHKVGQFDRRWSTPEKTSAWKAQTRRVALDLFITEVGKAGVVNLHGVAPLKVLAKMGFGDQVRLEAKKQRLIVKSESGEYLGEVEPRQGLRLIKLMRGGNRYDAAILKVEEHKVQVVIKEIYQHPSQVGHPSFPVKTTEHLRTRIKEGLLRRGIVTDEGEPISESEYSEEEEELGPEEESLPEGFTVIVRPVNLPPPQRMLLASQGFLDGGASEGAGASAVPRLAPDRIALLESYVEWAPTCSADSCGRPPPASRRKSARRRGATCWARRRSSA